MSCIWTETMFNPSTLDQLYSVSCMLENFVTKFTPDNVIYCPYCGEKVEEDHANT